jgi:hypothetical protein
MGGLSDAGGFGDASSLGDCRSGTYGTSVYLFCNVKVTWTTAHDNCASIGMRLVRVDDGGGNQYLHDNAYVAAPISGIWLGASDSAVEEEWRWLNGDLFWLGGKTGVAQNNFYNNWYVGAQPSSQQPQRDCVVLDNSAAAGWFEAIARS